MNVNQTLMRLAKENQSIHITNQSTHRSIYTTNAQAQQKAAQLCTVPQRTLRTMTKKILF